MFFVTFSSLWSFSIFFLLSYTTLILSILYYIIPVISYNNKYYFSKEKVNPSLINGVDLLYVAITPYIIFFLINFIWSSPTLSVWFGHVVITTWQSKIQYFIILTFVLVSYTFFNSVYFSSREIYDYVIVTFSFLSSVLGKLNIASVKISSHNERKPLAPSL